MRDAVQIENPKYAHEELFNQSLMLAEQGKTLDAAKKVFEARAAGSLIAENVCTKKIDFPCKAVDLTIELKNPEEIFKLGLCYFSGIGVTASEANAAKCFAAASKKGHVSAKIFFANMLVSEADIHLIQDETLRLKAGLDLLKEAAEAGDPEAQLSLGCLYIKPFKPFDAIPEKKRHEESEFWLKQSAQQNHIHALEKLADLYTNKRELLSSVDYNERLRIIKELLIRAITFGSANAHYLLGSTIIVQSATIYGDQREESIALAFEHLKKAAESSHGPAQVLLTRLYLGLQSISSNYLYLFEGGENKVLYYLREAACSGNPLALDLLLKQEDTNTRSYHLAIIEKDHKQFALDILSDKGWATYEMFDKEKLHTHSSILKLISQGIDYVENIRFTNSPFSSYSEKIAELRLQLFIHKIVDFTLADKIKFQDLSADNREQYIMHLYGIYISAKSDDRLGEDARKSAICLLTLYKEYGLIFPTGLNTLILSVALSELLGDDYFVTTQMPILNEDEKHIIIAIASSAAAAAENNSTLIASLKENMINQLLTRGVITKKHCISEPVLTTWQSAAQVSQKTSREISQQEAMSGILKHKPSTASKLK